MKLDNNYDPAVAKFLSECYENEHRKRITWNIKHANKISTAATFKGEPKNYVVTDPLRRAIEMQLPALTRDYISSTPNRYLRQLPDKAFVQGIKHLRRGHSILDLGLGDPKEDPRLARPDTDLSIDPVMRLVDPEVRATLYEHPPPKRNIYLKERYKLEPHDRYYLPETTYMEYGWRSKDSNTRQGRRFGRIAKMAEIYACRVGPQVDPPHYREVPPTTHTTCKMY